MDLIETQAYDVIHQPEHYTQGTIEPIDFIRANDLDFCEGNVIKYVVRAKWKGGKVDLEKARQYLDWLIEKANE